MHTPLSTFESDICCLCQGYPPMYPATLDPQWVHILSTISHPGCHQTIRATGFATIQRLWKSACGSVCVGISRNGCKFYQNLIAKRSEPLLTRWNQVSKAVYTRLINRVMGITRAGLISMIYDCTTNLNTSKLGDSQAVTLIGTDVERICNSLQAFHECWVSVIEVALAVYLLERQVGLTCVVPTVVSLGSCTILQPVVTDCTLTDLPKQKVCVLGTMPISRHIVPAQKQWVVRVQQRMATTMTMLANMKSIKMLGLTGTLDTIVSHLREVELKTSEVFRKLLICTVALCKSIPPNGIR
jgi:hypothetical protein